MSGIPDARASLRMPADLMAALQKRAEENGETFSDLLRRNALRELGICPTCGQKAPANGNEPGEDHR